MKDMEAGFKNSNAPTWIWYPGDYEIWLGNEMQNRRTERGAFFPPFWKMDSHYVLVEFSTKIDLQKPETITVYTEGKANIKLDGKLIPTVSPTLSGICNAAPLNRTELTIEAGKHDLNIKVYNHAHAPAIFVDGETVKSDGSWLVTFENKEWIDDSGKESASGTIYKNAGYWNFNSCDTPPSKFKLPVKPQSVVETKKTPGGVLYDFGKETFGFVKFHNLKGNGVLNLYYGESQEEALDVAQCDTLDRFSFDAKEAADFTIPKSRAFRYVYVENSAMFYDSVSMLYEYLPLDERGSFRCNDELLNRIWDVSAYTMQLTAREFFIDGIKRDRWVWSGDAYQSYLMNYYLFFDSPSVRRTILTLRGKDPITSHINTIMDYTFYWFISIYDYYMYTGDTDFIAMLYPRMNSLMEYCLSCSNDNGMMEWLVGDWVFIDWADFRMSKTGEVGFEQLLFYRSLKTMALCAEIVGQPQDRMRYMKRADDLLAKFFPAFWNDEKQAFVHNREKGVQSEQVTPYTNIFAVIFDYLEESKKQAIKQSVLMNPDALKITTPYMRFYELEALCKLGEHQHVLQEILAYWGGMLNLGATSFWEKYNPEQSGVEHLAMYGRPFGKSLCHSWGASPIYLLGRYFLGVQPEQPGYKTFKIQPVLGGLEWMEGAVPVPEGEIKLYMDKTQIKLSAPAGEGYLYFTSLSEPQTNIGNIEKLSGNDYRLKIESQKEYLVKVGVPTKK